MKGREGGGEFRKISSDVAFYVEMGRGITKVFGSVLLEKPSAAEFQNYQQRRQRERRRRQDGQADHAQHARVPCP